MQEEPFLQLSSSRDHLAGSNRLGKSSGALNQKRVTPIKMKKMPSPFHFAKAALLGVSMLVATGVAAVAEDAYLRSLEDRLEALENQLHRIQTDPKKGVTPIRGELPVYVTPKSKYVEELKIRGRFQWQAANVWGDGAGDYSTMEIRRARLGVEGKLADHFRFTIEINTLPSGISLSDAILRWNRYSEGNITVGHFKPRFGYEENTSSARIKTIERSLITNTLAPGRITGGAVHGGAGIFEYWLGFYNGEQNTNTANENPRYLYNASAGLDFSDFVGEGNTLSFRGDYMYTDDPNAVTSFEHSASGSMQVGFGAFNLRNEVLYGQSLSGGGNVWGVVVMPYIELTDKLELVLRYEYTQASFADGLRLQSRYQRRLPDLSGDRGDRYQAVYAGLNYYIHGDDLKLMFGVEWGDFDVRTGNNPGNLNTVTAFGAVRMQF